MHARAPVVDVVLRKSFVQIRRRLRQVDRDVKESHPLFTLEIKRAKVHHLLPLLFPKVNFLEQSL